jgi:RNA polymerase sigma-70 factor (ECF subfamily)
VTQLALVRPSISQAERPDVSAQHDEREGQGSEGPPFDDAGVAAAKRGDPAAWEAAYRAYGRSLMGYLMVRLDNREDAAEALSETFTRAISKASTLRGDAYAFRAWLFTIARHVSADEHRGRARVFVLGDQPELEDRSQPSGEELVIIHEDVAQLRKCFARLPKTDQEVLWLRVCSGLSAAEVGEVVGKRPGAVRMQQMRALDALRSEVRA